MVEMNKNADRHAPIFAHVNILLHMSNLLEEHVQMGYYVNVEAGVKIFIEDVNPEGNKTILFIHGWPLSHKQFEYQFNVLPAMGYRCIGIDWRGFGNSDKPVSGYHYDRLADDIRAVVGALRLENFTLAGHSTGGAIAIRYVARYNGYGISKLVLIDPAAPTGFTPETANKFLIENANDRPKMLQGINGHFFLSVYNRAILGLVFSDGIRSCWLVNCCSNKVIKR